ncbi:PREDICTED: BAG family molecular chaperone regulator 3-like [Tarenaya hassleriana]|uniref:BAG family molecular chaperone regulator 3-like n=1 Tax=Tarenaya hassleriana TaxID=28532 RepID=UPI00053C54C7|nr:PREDICTED: BAG family molecular chaperone regulator 3-like [Tarenaya hassleriana]
MMKMRTGTTTATVAGRGEGRHDWDLRSGGMMVQRRTDQSSGESPVIRVRVKYGSVYHEITINSQATFAELKKMLSGRTGLHHQDMKILYKDKERDSKMFLDLSGVKDRSKLILEEDPISQEKRLLEMRKNAAIEKASKSIADISLEVDRLAGQVSAFETVISKGGRVEEKRLVNLIEILMNQLLKLDAVSADGDVKSKRKMQVRRIQKYVETLDMLKIKNSAPPDNLVPKIRNGNFGTKKSVGSKHQEQEEQSSNSSEHRHESNEQQKRYEERDLLCFDGAEEEPRSKTFDYTAASTSATAPADESVPPRFKWEFFD